MIILACIIMANAAFSLLEILVAGSLALDKSPNRYKNMSHLTYSLVSARALIDLIVAAIIMSASGIICSINWKDVGQADTIIKLGRDVISFILSCLLFVFIFVFTLSTAHKVKPK